ncbi:MAG: phosphotransferase family protein [Gammaproteobacteria bacterium]|nr:phosphotransferase family protein [Gammaproteobacteria bacterium]
MFIDIQHEVPQQWDAIANWLQLQGLTLDLQAGIKQFASGVANLNYLISVNGKPAVLRRPPNGDLPPGAYDLSRQYKIYSRLGKVLSTVPKGIAYCEDTAIIGVPFFVIEFRKGTAISRELPAQLAEVADIGDTLSRLMVKALAQLHSIAPEAADLTDLGNPDGFVMRQVQGWHKRASRVMSADNMQKVTAITHWLQQHPPKQQRPAIIHLDFKLDNVLIDPDTLTVQGLIDWELSTLGDPVYDMVMMLVTWGEPNDDEVYDNLCCMPNKSQGWWTRRQVVAAYVEATGLDISAADIKFYWILALLRTLVAVAQLLALYERESMPNASKVDLPKVMNATLARACQLLDQPLDW